VARSSMIAMARSLSLSSIPGRTVLGRTTFVLS
jgi:hypothetical protein